MFNWFMQHLHKLSSVGTEYGLQQPFALFTV